MMMPGGPHQFGLSPRMMNQLNAQMTMAAAAAAASGQPPPGLGPRGALAGRMRFPGSYFMWSFFVFLSNNPRILGFEILNHCASNPVRSRPRATRHINGPNVKNPPKMWLKKFVKFTDHTCACHDLTNFEFEGNTIAGNGSYVNLQKLAEKNLWNHRTYFWRVLAFCNHCETL